MGKKWYRNYLNVGSSFWRVDSRKNTKFLVVFQDYKWWDLCWGG